VNQLSPELPNSNSEKAEIQFVQYLLNSYEKLFNKVLIERINPNSDYDNLVRQDFYLVSHRFVELPRFVFATNKALSLWEISWEDFYLMPSKYSAEEDERAKRQEMLESANRKGFFEGYEGIRISAKGNRFYIKNVLIFNVFDSNGIVMGQAALFYQTNPL
jgi:hypothetical protein